ncbi:MAG: flagellar type III secretion system pore protein FliP [Planctomycetota bacterium]|nr:flagellar type III secretion system pore protein FliP [Planctomycetota bacterium]
MPRATWLVILLAVVLTVVDGAGASRALAQGAVWGPPAPGAIAEPGADVGGLESQPGLGALANPLELIDAAGSFFPSSGRGAGEAGGSVGASATGGSTSDGEGLRVGGLSPALSILVLLTIVTLAPSIMLMTTSFVRIMIVLGLLRQAIGTPTIPPPQVLTALALFMTLLTMSPTLDRIHTEAIAPYQAGQVNDYAELWDLAKQPMRDFMFAQIDATGNWSSVYMVLEHRGVDTSRPDLLTRADVDMVTLVPAFMLSELKTAFLLGFKVYLPFLVIDLVISALLISMSMMMLPPVLISLPFKLLLFVMIDGWALVTSGLMKGFSATTHVASAGKVTDLARLAHALTTTGYG